MITNKQAAAKLIHKYALLFKTEINALANHQIAELTDRDKIADKIVTDIKSRALDMLQPIIDKMSNLMTPRKEKVKKNVEEKSSKRKSTEDDGDKEGND